MSSRPLGTIDRELAKYNPLDQEQLPVGLKGGYR